MSYIFEGYYKYYFYFDLQLFVASIKCSWFCICLLSYNIAKIISSSSFLVDSFGFSTQTVMPFAKTVLPFQNGCFYFSCLIVLAGIPSTALTKSGKNSYLIFFLILRGKAFSLSPVKYDVSCRFLQKALTRPRKFPSFSTLLRFQQEQMLNFVRCFIYSVDLLRGGRGAVVKMVDYVD